MSNPRPARDTRTCSVCGEPLAEHLRGYVDSLRGCAWHIEEWMHSPERHAAALAALATGRAMGHVPFEAWAAGMRAKTKAGEES